MTTVRQPMNDQSENPVIPLQRNRGDHTSTPGGASECVRAPYGGAHADGHAQEGADEPVTPSARARTATPDRYREGAAPEEKPTNPPSARTAATPLTAAAPSAAHRSPKRRRRDNENPKTKKLGFRCTDEQKAEIERLAKAAELNVADYLERKALGPVGSALTTHDERLDTAIAALLATRGQLAPLGNNANQIAYRLHLDLGVEPGPARSVLDTARTLVTEVRAGVAEVDASAMRLAKAKRR
ncbi:plasmid mobilization protein [Kitasatospora sp. NPDC052896]|uniref:plasmid mobilization protein n=1 Tax=Kitasatospora sp. NPDC052896 TaxID=3364061 RepID=UPI0037C6B117